MARYFTQCCKDIIDTEHVHDRKTCQCGAWLIGGGDYKTIVAPMNRQAQLTHSPILFFGNEYQ